MLKRLLVLVFIITVNVGTAFSQADAGVLSGIVTDTTGAAIAEATVTAVNAGTNAARTVKTAPNGTYQMENLTASVYEVSVTADGFAVLKAEVEVTVGGHAPLDAKLSAVGVTQTVEVESLGGSQVNTDSLEISEIISPQQVSELPSLTRNVYDFVAISGNISNGDAAQGHAENSANLGVGYSINGQRSSGTEILLDGIENTELFGDVVGIQVPIDSIAEVRMTTSNFEPQYGRASGGVVNVVTTSGTNRFHGTLTEFNRLAAYTANSVTGDLSGQPKGG
ncbi:carboxypeptidase regulatory-like domain-containing protein [Tunturibacter empetritectus]|uniref:Carboxypeptidase regulatory-like domain-containing protein n=1 Tax=Tunturiibacter empetritectus TaxID=3069691 RepID=A0AAU7ZDF9_9BACT